MTGKKRPATKPAPKKAPAKVAPQFTLSTGERVPLNPAHRTDFDHLVDDMVLGAPTKPAKR